MADKLYLNGELCDLGKSKVAMTYQINDIGELKDRQSNYSNTVKLPKTPDNRAILGSLENINLVNRKAYTKIDARLEASGTEIVPNGFAQVKTASDFYEAVIFSGLVSFFDKIKGKNLKDLDLSHLNHIWNVSNAVNSRNNTDGYIWAIADYGAMVQADIIFPVDKSVPSVFAKTIFDKIFSEAGVDYACTFLQSGHFPQVLIPCTDLQPIDVRTITATHNTASFFQIYPAYPLIFAFFNPDWMTDIENELAVTAFNLTITNNSTGWVSVLELTGDEQLFSGTIAPPEPLLLTIVSDENSIAIDGSGNITGLDGDYTFAIEATVENRSDDTSSFGFDYDNTGGLIIVPLHSMETLYGLNINAELDIAASLPDLKQDEFIKAFLQFYGLIPQPDPYTGEIVIKQFQDIKTNIAIAKDWSGKLSLLKEPKVAFEFGKYAQVNEMLYDNDDDVTPGLGRGEFTIDDETLLPLVTMFKSVFSASDSVIRLLDKNIAFVRKCDDEGELTEDPKPRVLFLQRETGDVTYRDGVNGDVTLNGVSLPLTFFVKGGSNNNLDFQTFIRLHYDALMDVLTDAKLVTADLLLTPRDIAELDHFIPVYISFFANYFYVNKLVNFIEGEATQGELIRV